MGDLLVPKLAGDCATGRGRRRKNPLLVPDVEQEPDLGHRASGVGNSRAYGRDWRPTSELRFLASKDFDGMLRAEVSEPGIE
jgi:hypothetical protein